MTSSEVQQEGRPADICATTEHYGEIVLAEPQAAAAQKADENVSNSSHGSRDAMGPGKRGLECNYESKRYDAKILLQEASGGFLNIEDEQLCEDQDVETIVEITASPCESKRLSKCESVTAVQSNSEEEATYPVKEGASHTRYCLHPGMQDERLLLLACVTVAEPPCTTLPCPNEEADSPIPIQTAPVVEISETASEAEPGEGGLTLRADGSLGYRGYAHNFEVNAFPRMVSGAGEDSETVSQHLSTGSQSSVCPALSQQTPGMRDLVDEHPGFPEQPKLRSTVHRPRRRVQRGKRSSNKKTKLQHELKKEQMKVSFLNRTKRSVDVLASSDYSKTAPHSNAHKVHGNLQSPLPMASPGLTGRTAQRCSPLGEYKGKDHANNISGAFHPTVSIPGITSMKNEASLQFPDLNAKKPKRRGFEAKEGNIRNMSISSTAVKKARLPIKKERARAKGTLPAQSTPNNRDHWPQVKRGRAKKQEKLHVKTSPSIVFPLMSWQTKAIRMHTSPSFTQYRDSKTKRNESLKRKHISRPVANHMVKSDDIYRQKEKRQAMAFQQMLDNIQIGNINKMNSLKRRRILNRFLLSGRNMAGLSGRANYQVNISKRGTIYMGKKRGRKPKGQTAAAMQDSVCNSTSPAREAISNKAATSQGASVSSMVDKPEELPCSVEHRATNETKAARKTVTSWLRPSRPLCVPGLMPGAGCEMASVSPRSASVASSDSGIGTDGFSERGEREPTVLWRQHGTLGQTAHFQPEIPCSQYELQQGNSKIIARRPSKIKPKSLLVQAVNKWCSHEFIARLKELVKIFSQLKISYMALPFPQQSCVLPTIFQVSFPRTLVSTWKPLSNPWLTGGTTMKSRHCQKLDNFAYHHRMPHCAFPFSAPCSGPPRPHETLSFPCTPMYLVPGGHVSRTHMQYSSAVHAPHNFAQQSFPNTGPMISLLPSLAHEKNCFAKQHQSYPPTQVPGRQDVSQRSAKMDRDPEAIYVPEYQRSGTKLQDQAIYGSGAQPTPPQDVTRCSSATERGNCPPRTNGTSKRINCHAGRNQPISHQATGKVKNTQGCLKYIEETRNGDGENIYHGFMEQRGKNQIIYDSGQELKNPNCRGRVSHKKRFLESLPGSAKEEIAWSKHRKRRWLLSQALSGPAEGGVGERLKHRKQWRMEEPGNELLLQSLHPAPNKTRKKPLKGNTDYLQMFEVTEEAVKGRTDGSEEEPTSHIHKDYNGISRRVPGASQKAADGSMARQGKSAGHDTVSETIEAVLRHARRYYRHRHHGRKQKLKLTMEGRNKKKKKKKRGRSLYSQQ
uniref:uncharacterized protein n=1 Tax=Myxine glutinosa TaxID=7769 RepID=UPI00358DE72C